MNVAAEPRTGNFFIADIEVLRGIAVLLVIFMHSFYLFPWENSYVRSVGHLIGGWSGVDLFFCISGFVIARDLLKSTKEAKSRSQSFLSFSVPFWIRRIWRILPSAWLWATFALFASAFLPFLPGAGDLQVVYPEWVSSMLQMGNIYYLTCSPNCAWGSVFLTVYWSLGLEEQFYLVLPFIIFFLSRKTCISLLILLFFTQFFLYRPQAPAYTLWYMRTDAIILGVLIAFAHNQGDLAGLRPTYLSNAWARRFLVSFLVLMLGGLAVTNIFISTGMIALVSGSLVLIASFNGSYILADGYFKSLMMWVGSRSFALYLIHLPSFAFTRAIIAHWKNPSHPYSDHNTFLFVILAVFIASTLAELNFRLLEQPLRRYGRTLADNATHQISLTQSNSFDIT